MPARLNKMMVILIAAATVLTIACGAGAYWFFIMRNDPDRRIALAQEYIAAGDYAMASEQYRVAFRRRSNDLELLYSYIDTTAMVQTDDRALAQAYFQRIAAATRQ